MQRLSALYAGSRDSLLAFALLREGWSPLRRGKDVLLDRTEEALADKDRFKAQDNMPQREPRRSEKGKRRGWNGCSMCRRCLRRKATCGGSLFDLGTGQRGSKAVGSPSPSPRSGVGGERPKNAESTAARQFGCFLRGQAPRRFADSLQRSRQQGARARAATYGLGVPQPNISSLSFEISFAKSIPPFKAEHWPKSHRSQQQTTAPVAPTA